MAFHCFRASPVLPGILAFLLLAGGWGRLLPAQTTEVVWRAPLPDVGTFSSVRTADLNRDGILDVVIGAGRQEFHACDSAVVAFDGATGQVLWTVGARDQMFGSAAFLDISNDSVPDVFIGGRSAELKAIDGATGREIWTFFPEGDSLSRRAHQYFNFYNPQFIPDQNGDGLPDLLVANGGDVMVEAYDPDRPPGSLLVIGSNCGEVLARAYMPDGRETYMSPVVFDLDRDGVLEILFGSGGETVGGSLFIATLPELLGGDLSGAYALAILPDKGFIAPPALADLTADGVYDIVANAVNGQVLAFDGSSLDLLWGWHIADTEVYSAPAVADLTGDGVPDVFSVFANGVWPLLTGTRPLLMDGAKGQALFVDSIGFYQTSSPVIVDVTNDGNDDVIVSANLLQPKKRGQRLIHNVLLAYDIQRGSRYVLSEAGVGANVASTPWAGDLDGDGRLDIVHCRLTTPDRAYTFGGLELVRLRLPVPVRTKPAWGAYMGTEYDGVYRPDP